MLGGCGSDAQWPHGEQVGSVEGALLGAADGQPFAAERTDADLIRRRRRQAAQADPQLATAQQIDLQAEPDIVARFDRQRIALHAIAAEQQAAELRMVDLPDLLGVEGRRLHERALVAAGTEVPHAYRQPGGFALVGQPLTFEFGIRRRLLR